MEANGKQRSEEDEVDEPPPTKKAKTEPNGQLQHVPKSIQPPKCPDFLVGNLEDFYRAYPAFRQPSEIGFFSFNENGDMILDRSGLRYYSQPSRLGLDLTVGYSDFKPKLNQTPDLRNILTWISNKWECFLPKIKSQKSIESLLPLGSGGASATAPTVVSTNPPTQNTAATAKCA